MQTLVEIGPFSASQGQHRRKDATEQMKNLTHARTRNQVPGFTCADALTLGYGCQWQNLNFYPCKLPDHKFTPLPSLHVDFSRHVVTYCFFIICPLLISLYNVAVFVIICRLESTLLLKYANPCRNFTFLRFAMTAQKKGRNGTNEKSDTRKDSNPGPRVYLCRCFDPRLRVPVAEPEFLSL